MYGVLALIMVMFLVNQAGAGAWTPNNFIYKPALGARGQTEKNTYDAGLDRVDTHLGKYKTLGDPGSATLSEALTTIGSAAASLVIPPRHGEHRQQHHHPGQRSRSGAERRHI